jgi:DNA polymerase III alpha subunit
VRRHRRLAESEYLHPALVPLLEDTYGVVLYQEQVLRIASELAGLSLADADLLRRAMSHFDPGERMRTLKERFIAGALARSQVPGEVAERVWQLMAAFAGYGFPKAHAASYAQLAWRAAWCKVHEPAVFLAAVLANWGGYYSQRVYLTEARRSGLALQPPHVNYAGREFSVKYPDGQPTLFMGLDQVRDLSRRTQARIVRERPFRSLADFLARADPRPVEAENLIQAGALEGWGAIPALLRQLRGEVWRGGQLPLFDFAALNPADGPGEDWSLVEKVSAQEAILGVAVIAHPLQLAAAQVAASGALNTLEAGAQIGRRVRVAGMRQVWRRSRTTQGETLYFMSLEDLEGLLEVVISSGLYKRSQAAFSDRAPLVVEGEVLLDPSIGEPFLRAEKIWRLE